MDDTKMDLVAPAGAEVDMSEYMVSGEFDMWKRKRLTHAYILILSFSGNGRAYQSLLRLLSRVIPKPTLYTAHAPTTTVLWRQLSHALHSDDSHDVAWLPVALKRLSEDHVACVLSVPGEIYEMFPRRDHRLPRDRHVPRDAVEHDPTDVRSGSHTGRVLLRLLRARFRQCYFRCYCRDDLPYAPGARHNGHSGKWKNTNRKQSCHRHRRSSSNGFLGCYLWIGPRSTIQKNSSVRVSSPPTRVPISMQTRYLCCYFPKKRTP